ncbi:FAD:protein FMN transferase [Microbacterium sp.]|uniref:FAD:protein FMN transferase n=1 Tax=Microbacterium sp. TaxID=51671 RepID=UPI003341DB36
MNGAATLPARTATDGVMGTVASVQVIGDIDPALFRTAVEGCFADLHRADRVFSPFRADSDLRRLARGELSPADADPWMDEVAAGCGRAEEETGGLFRAQRQGGFDPTGYVKGWAAENAARTRLAPLLRESGVTAVGLNVGGDMQLFTAPGADWTWNVGIVDPRDRARLLATVSVRDGAVATSGGAERGAHIVDPRTGVPARGVLSATVVGDGLTRADVWATAVVAAGPDGLGWLDRIGPGSGLLLDDGGRVRRWLDGVPVDVTGVTWA